MPRVALHAPELQPPPTIRLVDPANTPFRLEDRTCRIVGSMGGDAARCFARARITAAAGVRELII
jgi:hypothetical protein